MENHLYCGDLVKENRLVKRLGTVLYCCFFSHGESICIAKAIWFVRKRTASSNDEVQFYSILYTIYCSCFRAVR